MGSIDQPLAGTAKPANQVVNLEVLAEQNCTDFDYGRSGNLRWQPEARLSKTKAGHQVSEYGLTIVGS